MAGCVRQVAQCSDRNQCQDKKISSRWLIPSLGPLRTVFFRSWRLLWIRACDCVNTPARTQLSLLKTVRKASLHKAEITNEVNSRWELIYREPFWIFLGRQEAAGELCIDERRTAIFQEDDPGCSQFKMPASHTAMSARKLFWGLVCKAPWTPRIYSSIKRKDGATEPCNWIPSKCCFSCTSPDCARAHTEPATRGQSNTFVPKALRQNTSSKAWKWPTLTFSPREFSRLRKSSQHASKGHIKARCKAPNVKFIQIYE